MEWIIYKHTSPSGRIYIGQTCQKNPNVRWQYGHGYKSNNTKFYRAIKKYGWSNFSHEIIEKNISNQQTANEREIYWISFYDSFNNGYNSTPGGNMVGDNVPTKPVVQIQIDKPNIIYKQYKSAVEAERITGICGRNIGACCLKQGQITAGGYYWCFLEDFDKFEPQVKRQGKENVRKVYCFETDSVFDSIVDASKNLNISKDGINACCRNKQLTAGNCHFCYYEDKDFYIFRERKSIERTTYNPYIKENLLYQIDKKSLKILHEFINITNAAQYTNISRQQIGKCASGKLISAGGFYWCKKDNWFDGWCPEIKTHPNAKEVYCIETNQKFNTLSEAARTTGINSSSISECCNKKLNTAGDLHWCFYSEYIEGNYKIPVNKNEKKVVCVETKEIFNTLKEAADKYKVSASNISDCIKNLAHTSGGVHWRLLEDFENNADEMPRQRVSVMRKVRNIDKNIVFSSIRDAAQAYGICEQNINRVCRKQSKTAGGYHWEYVD